MPVPLSKVLANKKYRAKAYDTIGFDVPKGKRDEYKAKAAANGLSLAKFLFLAAESYGVKLEDGNVVIPATEKVAPERISAEERRLLVAAAKFPTDTRKLFLKLVEDLAAKLESKSGD